MLNIAVDTAGLYALSYADLHHHGLIEGATDSSRLRLTHRGEEVALWIEDGGDERFEAGDRLLFYASGLSPTDPQRRYTSYDVYVLQLGSGAPARVALQNANTATSGDPALNFYTRARAEEDQFYWQTLLAAPETDRWYWGDRLAPATAGLASEVDYPIELGHAAATASPALVRVELMGVTHGRHRAQLALNGHALGEATWAGQLPFISQHVADSVWLKPGSNLLTVSVVATERSAGELEDENVDQLLLNWIEVDYPAAYVAYQNQLHFTLAAVSHAVISGFTSAAVELWDVTRPHVPKRLTPESPATGDPTVRVDNGAAVARQYVAVAEDAILTPRFLEGRPISNWRAPSQGADYIVITHASLAQAVHPLVERRAAQGLRVAVVDIAELYDEFSHGLMNPDAIGDFLTYATREWPPPAPHAVLLVGDAYQDYRNILADEPRTLVPAPLTYIAPFGETVSDVRLAEGIAAPLQIGRLPAQNVLELSHMVDKILAHEQPDPQAAWRRRLLLVADDDEAAFGDISTAIAGVLPADVIVQRLDIAAAPDRDPAPLIAAAFERGAAFVNYAGHGEYFRWGRWQNGAIWGEEDVAALTHAPKLPVVTIANCLNGFFSGPRPSLGERLLQQPSGGAVAVWAPAALGYPAAHQPLMTAFYAAIFQQDAPTLGAAVAQARTRMQSAYPQWQPILDSYILLGDPAMPLLQPLHPPRILAISPPAHSTDQPLDASVTVTFSKPMDPTQVVITENGLPLEVVWDPSRQVASTAARQRTHGAVQRIAVHGRDAANQSELAAGEVPSQWQWQVTWDDLPPAVDMKLDQNSRLMLTFTEPVRPASVRFEITPPLELPDDGVLLLRWNEAATVAWLEHPPLPPSLHLLFTLQQARDRAGNDLAGPIFATLQQREPLPSVYLPILIRKEKQ